ncbi:MAG: glycosyltransferase family 2 protein [Deltaproteobacteria bacterium]|jgi:glycosyltransferase involved in cell wall biosynthesis|nr:glycosyltransferase family 2 protein [Deltaproteobacteria bacterium]
MLLTTVIMTRNELRNIEGAVRSCAGLPGEILVVDHMSGDGTPDAARSLGCRVLSEALPDISQARNLAVSEAAGDWLLFLDADERLTPKLISLISRHIEKSPGRCASFTRENVAFGRRMRFGPLWPDRVVRLFPKGSVSWEGLVHERPVTEAPATALKGSVTHFTYPDYRAYLDKQALYARLWAENARRAGRRATAWKAFSRAFFAFLKMAFLKLGLLDGPAGWCLCWYYSGAYTMAKYLLLADSGAAAAAKAEDEAAEPEKPAGQVKAGKAWVAENSAEAGEAGDATPRKAG